MANFNIAYADTLHNEGLYANNPHDKGGETFGGVARNYWPNWTGWAIIDEAKRTNKVAATINAYAKQHGIDAHLKTFYEKNFWDVLKLDLVNDQQLANNIYDFGVNAGTDKAAKYLQRIAGVTEDRIIGPMTLKAVNLLNGKVAYDKYNDLRSAFYKRIAANPGQAEFAHSWLNRLKPYIACLLLWLLCSCATHRIATTAPKPPKEHQIDYVGLGTFFGAAIILFTWKFKTE